MGVDQSHITGQLTFDLCQPEFSMLTIQKGLFLSLFPLMFLENVLDPTFLLLKGQQSEL